MPDQGMVTIVDHLERTAAHPDRASIILPGEDCSFGQLLERSQFVGRVLIGLGVTRGDHVGIYMVNSADYVASIFATSMAGAVAVPISSRFRKSEMQNAVENVDMQVILTSQVVDDRTPRAAALADAIAARGEFRHSISRPTTA